MAVASMAGMGATADLGYGLGDMLRGQQQDMTDEEARKKRLGMSSMGLNPLNFGMTGVAAADLGYSRAGR